MHSRRQSLVGWEVYLVSVRDEVGFGFVTSTLARQNLEENLLLVCTVPIQTLSDVSIGDRLFSSEV